MADYSSPDYGTTPTYTPTGTDAAPLFGEQKRGVRLIAWLIAAALGIMVIFTTVVGIVFGVLNEIPQHIMLVGTMLCFTVLLLAMWRMQITGDQDPKMVWLLFGMIIVLILMCVTINAYAWPEPPAKCEAPPNCPDALYNTQSKTCVLSGVTTCYSQGTCPLVTSLTQSVSQCCNCNYTTCALPSSVPKYRDFFRDV